MEKSGKGYFKSVESLIFIELMMEIKYSKHRVYMPGKILNNLDVFVLDFASYSKNTQDT